MESGGAGGVQRPAVPRPAFVYVVLGHEQVDVGGGLRSHIHGAIGFVVSQLDRAVGRDGNEGAVEEEAGVVDFIGGKLYTEIFRRRRLREDKLNGGRRRTIVQITSGIQDTYA